MYKPIKSVIAKEGYKLILTFEDGTKRQLEMQSFMEKPPFDKLKDFNIFKQVSPSFETVEWPFDIDIDPEVLLEESYVILDFKA